MEAEAQDNEQRRGQRESKGVSKSLVSCQMTEMKYTTSSNPTRELKENYYLKEQT